MSEEPKHIGITHRVTGHQSGYIVQVGGSTIGGFHCTYASATQALCKAKGVTTSELTLKTKFRKVSQTKACRVPYLFHRRGKWYSPQVPLGKTFQTAEEAMQAVKKSRKGKRFLAAATKDMASVKGPTTPPSKLAHRVKCLAEFTLKDPKRKWLPADAAAAVDHRVKSRKMYHCDPVLHFTSLLVKYRPWKDKLLQEWQKQPGWPSKDNRVQSPDPASFAAKVDYKQALAKASARGKALQQLLNATAKEISKKPVKPEWGANANRHGSHFSGPASLMHLKNNINQRGFCCNFFVFNSLEFFQISGEFLALLGYCVQGCCT